MRRFSTAMFACVTLAAIPAHAAAASQDSGTVAAGVTVVGIDLSGLTLQQASDKLAADLDSHLTRKLVVRVAGRRAELPGAEAELKLDALTTAKRAIRSKVAGPVPAKFTYSRAAVTAWVAKLATKVNRPARDATMKIGLRRVTVRKSRVGTLLIGSDLVAKIGDRLTNPGSSRLLRTKVLKIRANVTANDLRTINGGTVVTIDKKHFKLRLFKRLKYATSYQVAIGQPAYPTPSGRFQIQNKQVNPVWSVPNSPWAGELGGTTVSGGSPSNPLKARWMGITDGVGIHGTGEPWSVGTAASHGCLRMRVPDVIKLYPRVPVGTPVLIR